MFPGRQRLTVGHALETDAAASLSVMTDYAEAQCLVNALVEKDAHLPAGEQRLFRSLNGVERHLPAHRGETFQKAFHAVAGFNIVEQRADQYLAAASCQIVPNAGLIRVII